MTEADAVTAFDQHEHDHRKCVVDALSVAESMCEREGARLTPLRRRVLELIWSRRKPVGAYELLDELSRERGRVAPPTVYRAIEFLLDQGLIHRIESLNAFVGCSEPRRPHAGYFLICRGCGATAELKDRRIDGAIRAGAQRLGFRLEGQTVELRGLCPACADEGGARVAH
ncbi:Fur family transcriptional regulator [Ferruginivarius sediminum]|uniref:Transcriptional repressor n=1 Tax=Ferruginivarius sediminum TaxID=2661937 RepID=A0A369T6I4_9PROT|nr:Fur family transcriptional regulator [Ferruginivarius sediminum]RDD60930.1 transcriptional repressor [Ferruginivarius sediminum]